MQVHQAYERFSRAFTYILFKASFKIPSDYLASIFTYALSHRTLSSLFKQRTFSERIALRKVRPHPSYSMLTDKVAVRDFVSARVGVRYLIPIYAVVDDLSQFDFSHLPNEYVMKATHGSGWVKMVRASDNVDAEALRDLASSWLRTNYYLRTREAHYKGISPKILFERMLLEDAIPARDFKVHCFRRDGKLTQIVQVHSDRFGNHRVNFFTPDWHPIKLSHGLAWMPPEDIPIPSELSEMLVVADRLSQGVNYVRVDLYASAGCVYFGELTFTPAAGLRRFYPREVDRQWAELFDKDCYT